MKKYVISEERREEIVAAVDVVKDVAFTNTIDISDD